MGGAPIARARRGQGAVSTGPGAGRPGVGRDAPGPVVRVPLRPASEAAPAAPSRRLRPVAPAREHPVNAVLVSPPAVSLLLLGLGAAAWAGPADAVARLVAEGKHAQARERCARAGQPGPTDDEPLREACADAAFPAAEAEGTAAAWAAFRAAWPGTAAAGQARVREAEAALREADPAAPEAVWLALAEAHRGTPSAARFQALAGDAAVRDAQDGAAAVAAATRYPAHPALPRLVEAFPGAFLHVRVAGRRVEVEVRPPVPLTEERAPVVRWVAQDPAGTQVPWDEAARESLLAWGLPAAALGARLASGEPAPVFPICPDPARPAGFAAGVRVQVGSGAHFVPVPWDEDCGGARPAVIVHRDGGVAALSLGPGHGVDLRARSTAGGRRTLRAFLGAAGPPELAAGAVHQAVGGATLVTPLTGGASWLSPRAPVGGWALGGLRSAGLPAGWSLEPRGEGLALRGPGLGADWALPAGEVRVLLPFAAEVLGLVGPPAAPAAALPAAWAQGPDGALRREPPPGATVAGLLPLEAPGVEGVRAALGTVGLDPGRLAVVDGWQADLDGDRRPESVLRARYDGVLVVLVVSPQADGSPRLFMEEVPRVMADGRPADTPFTFRQGERVSLAWGGVETLGAARRQPFVVLVRPVGPSFEVVDLDLGAPPG